MTLAQMATQAEELFEKYISLLEDKSKLTYQFNVTVRSDYNVIIPSVTIDKNGAIWEREFRNIAPGHHLAAEIMRFVSDLIVEIHGVEGEQK